MHVDREFRLFAIPLLVGPAALALVGLFFFPDDLYPVGSVVHVAVAIVAAVGLGAVAWQVARGINPSIGGVGGE